MKVPIVHRYQEMGVGIIVGPDSQWDSGIGTYLGLCSLVNRISHTLVNCSSLSAFAKFLKEGERERNRTIPEVLPIHISAIRRRPFKMSTRIGLSTPVLAPLLPVTGTFAAPFAAYFTFLSCRVVYHRFQEKYFTGDPDAESHKKLYLANRCHQNFIENVPLSLALAAFAELNGGNRKSLTYALGALFVSRVLHSDFGLINGLSLGRPIGYWGSLAITSYLGVYAAYLVKGYWGF
ncbi:MAPEG family-domain-containing protein [Xylariomycetidae sp. FL2044]|nr:MAPEG family-domain-containing protein [Xylariomycetidae sp. FL2044]